MACARVAGYPRSSCQPRLARPRRSNIGDGGNKEGPDKKYYPQPKHSAFREPSFGHGTLDLVDATHAGKRAGGAAGCCLWAAAVAAASCRGPRACQACGRGVATVSLAAGLAAANGALLPAHALDLFSACN